MNMITTTKEQSRQITMPKATTEANIFEQLMEVSKYCSLGQITHALYEVGGEYRRNM